MRLVPGPGALSNYYDRAGGIVARHVTLSAVAPHTETVRATYDVPLGKRALIESIVLRIRRASAATTYGFAYLRVDHGPTASPTNPIAYLSLTTNELLDERVLNLTDIGVAVENESIRVVSGDNSTGGTVNYEISVRCFEFV